MGDAIYLRRNIDRQWNGVAVDMQKISSVVISSANLDEYEQQLSEFLARQSDLHFYQTLDWYRCAYGVHDLFFIITKSDDKILASSLVRRKRIPVLGRAVYKIERGPVLESGSVLEIHLNNVLEKLQTDALFIAISPYQYGDALPDYQETLSRSGWRPSPRILAPYNSTIVIDLSTDIVQLRAGLRRSLKTQLNRGPRLGVEVRRAGSAEEFSKFIAQHNEMAQRRSLAPIQKEVAGGMSKLYQEPAGSVQLFVAYYEGEQVAGICLLGAGNRVVYEWGVSSEAESHRQLPLTHMLHWSAIQWAKQAGYTYYDFGGYWEERGDSDPINRFKTGFSKEKQHFVSEYIFGVRPLLTKMYQTAARLRAGA